MSKDVRVSYVSTFEERLLKVSIDEENKQITATLLKNNLKGSDTPIEAFSSFIKDTLSVVSGVISYLDNFLLDIEYDGIEVDDDVKVYAENRLRMFEALEERLSPTCISEEPTHIHMNILEEIDDLLDINSVDFFSKFSSMRVALNYEYEGMVWTSAEILVDFTSEEDNISYFNPNSGFTSSPHAVTQGWSTENGNLEHVLTEAYGIFNSTESFYNSLFDYSIEDIELGVELELN